MAENNTQTGLNSLKEGSTNSTAIADYYDDWAETYDATLSNWDYQAPADAAASLCKYMNSGERILDVGCGTGMFASALSKRMSCHIDGIDISEASLKIAGEKGLYAALHKYDLQAPPLPLPGDTFDGAACVGVLTYIEKAENLLADLCRVVRPGGHIVFTQRNDRWNEMNFDALIKDLQKRGLWTPLTISEARPYLPNNDDFSDSIEVIHVLCKVTRNHAAD